MLSLSRAFWAAISLEGSMRITSAYPWCSMARPFTSETLRRACHVPWAAGCGDEGQAGTEHSESHRAPSAGGSRRRQGCAEGVRFRIPHAYAPSSMAFLTGLKLRQTRNNTVTGPATGRAHHNRVAAPRSHKPACDLRTA